MKLLELQIDNVRGLPQLHLRPNGKNFVIWGPNGSGKSAVVDAIDFLLTGRISRLTGRGTGELSLARHGRHVDHDLKDARVRGVLLLPGTSEAVEVSRAMATPEVLECPDSVRGKMGAIQELARRGQHVLTRREMLRFVSVEGGTRAQDVQELLAISEVEEIRKALVTAENSLRTEYQEAARSVEQCKSDVSAAIQEESYQEARVLQIVNENRSILGGEPISELTSSLVHSKVEQPGASLVAPGVDTSLLEKDVNHIRELLGKEVAADDQRLRELIAAIRDDTVLRHALSHVELTERGLELLDETGRCPLCGAQWEPDELRSLLEDRKQKGREAEAYRSRLLRLAEALRTASDNLGSSVEKVAEAAEGVGLNGASSRLATWRNSLSKLSQALVSPLETYEEEAYPSALVSRLYAPAEIEQLLGSILQTAKSKYPGPKAEVTAWTSLVRLRDELQHLERASAAHSSAAKSLDRAEFLKGKFLQSRDRVLEDLYRQIRDRFVEFYRVLHPDESDHFSADLQPRGAALDFSVDFLGRGTHPPHALHSEGHQDSMGLCLFLALSERLSGSRIELVILDDVIMSIDSDHRKDVCRLLANAFPSRQLIITTHDRTWAKQLRSHGLVERDNFIEFWRWNIDTGPIVGQGQDMWQRIEQDLEKGHVGDAAHKLRVGSEQYFESVCDALRAKIAYRSDGRWDLNDWLSAAMSRYSSVLGKAKAAAQSWNNEDAFEELKVADSVRAQVYKRTQVDQWAIDAHIHYNNWANLTGGEFTNVVEAFRDLFELFRCQQPQCRQVLEIAYVQGEPASLKCPCGKINWNLKKR